MKIENKDFTFFDYLDSLKRQKNKWQAEKEFQNKNDTPYSQQSYIICVLMLGHLQEEINHITHKLEC